MLSLSSVHHIAIISSDYDSAVEFYVNKLGFTVLSEIRRPERSDIILHLQVNAETELEVFVEANPPARPSYPEAAGLRHLAFRVDDIEKAVSELAAIGIETEPIREEPDGRRLTFFRDSDGLPLELHE